MTDWLREEIEREFVVERGTWASERAERVTAALQQGVPDARRFESIVVWLAEHTAFTAPGRTIYLGRRLLERMPDDDAAAFIVAHELAHHELGHVPDLSHHWAKVPLAVLLTLLERWIAGPAHERDADLQAIERCVAAGFDPERCIKALEILDLIVLDHGDVDGSLGSDRPDAPARSHPPVRRRIDAVRAHLAAMPAGRRLADALSERRRARQRRLAQLAGAAAVGLALVIVRRRL